jgi:hypothetical protein
MFGRKYISGLEGISKYFLAGKNNLRRFLAEDD